MKVLGILGSPHGRKGSTGKLLSLVLKGADEAGAETGIISLSETTVLPCNACDTCHRSGKCPLPDDFATAKERMLAADGVILASPNYMENVSAYMKALMDRSSSIVHCKMLEGKFGAGVVSSGSGEDEEVVKILLRFLNACGMQAVGAVNARSEGIGKLASEKEVTKRAVSLGREIVKAIEEKRAYPEQAEFLKSHAERMKSLITMRKDDWPFEYEYWQKKERR